MRIAVHLTPEKGLPKKGLSEMLHSIADSGYRNVEVTGIVDSSAEAFRNELDEAGLNVVAFEVELHELSARPEQIAKDARALGAEWIVITPLYLDEFGDGWKLTGARLSKLAEQMRAEGFRVAYRNGKNDFVKDGDSTGLENLLIGAGPALDADLDLDTAQKTGEGPVGWLKRLEGRAPLTHITYKHQAQDGAKSDSQNGWHDIVATADTTGVEWALVELENKTDTLVEDAKSSHEFFKSLGFED